MLEFSGWFFFLAIQFCVLIVLLHYILFKPVIKTFDERKETVEGSFSMAKEMSKRCEAEMDSLKKELTAAAHKAKETFEAMKSEGLKSQHEALSKAYDEASKYTAGARDTLRSDAEKTRAGLRTEVEKFADDIVERLITA